MSDIKDKIIDTTISLILKSDGNPNTVTIRAIAKEANIGVGLINYHFQTKNLLIETSIQTFISQTIKDFIPSIDNRILGKDKLKLVACEVMDFLMHYPDISSISIISDQTTPKINDNTMRTIQGLNNSTQDVQTDTITLKKQLYGLVAIMQSTFLRRDIAFECFGVNMSNKSERDNLINFYIDRLF